MIGVLLKSGLFASEFFEMSFSGLRTAFLQALSEGMHACACLLNRLPAKGFTIAVSSQVHNPEIDTKYITCFLWLRCGNSQCYCQIERPIAIEHVSLSFNGFHASGLIVPNEEGNDHPPTQCQERNMCQTLEAHDPLIIDNRALRPERGLNALVTLVGFTSLADAADSQLSGKLVRGTKFTIYKFLQLKLASSLLCKSHRSYIIGSIVERMHGVKECLSLFSCRSEF